jgi:hypothetical protein
MTDLITAVINAKHVDIFGFYSHFGRECLQGSLFDRLVIADDDWTDAYKSRSADMAIDYLQDEIACANEAAGTAIELLGCPPPEPFVLSFGATPTAQVAAYFNGRELNGILEL